MSSRYSHKHIFVTGLSRGQVVATRSPASLKDLNGRRLPCPIRSEQAEALAGLNLEAKPAHGFQLTVVGLAQIAALDSNGHAGILAWGRLLRRIL
jgi:hypothetical protein